MVHKEGKQGEEFIFNSFNSCFDIKTIHNPCDFLINDKVYLEVKSCKLMTRKYKDKNILQYGRFECWDKSQIKKLESLNPYICFVVTKDWGNLILGFIKYKHVPNKRLISIREVMGLNLISEKEFLKRLEKIKPINRGF